MKPGKLALLRFPYADHRGAKLRPVLLIAQLPGVHDDWLVAMVSSQADQAVSQFDELISEQAPDFAASGLKKASVIRIGRLAVAEAELLVGELGAVSDTRFDRIRQRIASWILGQHDASSAD